MDTPEHVLSVRQFAIDVAIQALEPSIDADADTVVAFAATIARFVLDGTQAQADDSFVTVTSDPAPKAPSPSVSAEAINPAAVVPPSPVAETPAPVALTEPTAALTDPNPAPVVPAQLANDPAAQVPAPPPPTV